MPQKVVTADNLREVAGVGSVINAYAGQHKGYTKRATETRANRGLEDVTSQDIGKSRKKEAPFC